MRIQKFIEIIGKKTFLKLTLLSLVSGLTAAKVITTLEKSKDYFSLTANHANLQYNLGETANVTIDTKIKPAAGSAITFDAYFNNAPVALSTGGDKLSFQKVISSYGNATVRVVAYLENQAEMTGLKKTLDRVTLQITQIDELISGGSTDPRLPSEKAALLLQKAEIQRKISAQRQYAQEKTLTLTSTDPRPRAMFANAGQAVNQSTGGQVIIPVSLSSPSNSPVVVPYTVSGTATGADEDLTSGVLTFAANETSKDIVVTLTGNSTNGTAKTAIISLQESATATLGNVNVFTLTINDLLVPVPQVTGLRIGIETPGIPSYATIGVTGLSSSDAFGHIKIEFGDGTSMDMTQEEYSVNEGFRHLYTTAGDYNLTLTVYSLTGEAGPPFTAVLHVNGLEKPVPALTVQSVPGNASALAFDASGFTNPNHDEGSLSYEWKFQDGSPEDFSTGPVISHSFMGPPTLPPNGKTFSVRLRVLTPTLERTQVTIPVVMAQDHSVKIAAPVPVLSQTLFVGDAPLHVHLDASHSVPGPSPMASTTWDFGDSNAGFPSWQVGNTADYTYAYPGTYQAALWLRDQDGNVTRQSITVIVADPSHALPASQFYALWGGNNTKVNFSLGERGYVGAIDNFHVFWNYGDGMTEGGSRFVQREYAASEGMYSVQAKGYDVFGNQFVIDKNLTLHPGPGNNFPTADIGGQLSVYNIPAGISQQYGNVSFSDPQGLPLTVRWLFCGNKTSGDVAAGASVEQTFIDLGLCQMSAFATNSEGRSGEGYAGPWVVDGAGPVAQPVADHLVGAAPLTVTFNEDNFVTQYPIDKSIWTFNDQESGQEAALASPAVHTYVKPGTYYAMLAVKDTHGNVTPSYLPILVVPPEAISPHPAPPSFDFQSATDSGNHIGIVVNDVSVNSSSSYEIFVWDFGDGLKEYHMDSNNLGHVYAAAGTYTITATMTNGDGQTYTVTHDVTIAGGSLVKTSELRPRIIVPPPPQPIDYNNEDGCVQVGSVIRCNINDQGEGN